MRGGLAQYGKLSVRQSRANSVNLALEPMEIIGDLGAFPDQNDMVGDSPGKGRRDGAVSRKKGVNICSLASAERRASLDRALCQR